MADISFDDLIPKSESNDISFDDLIPEKEEKGSYFSGAQGLVPDAIEGYVDVAEDIGKGIGAGVLSIPQGIMELGAIGVDLALDTDTASAVTEAFEYIKPDVGTAGAVTEELTAFGVGFIPVVGWLGRAGQAASAANKGIKLSKAGRTKFGKSAIDFGESDLGRKMLKSTASKIGTYGVASMGYGVAVSPDGRSTLSDNFAALPDFVQTQEDTGLTGRSEAVRRLRNKFVSGVEDGLMSMGVDTALTGFGAGARAIGRTETGAAAAKAIRQAPGKVSDGMAKGFEAIGMGAVNEKAAGAKKLFTEYFTPSGGADVNVYETVQDARAVADRSEKRGVQAALDWDKASKKFFKASKLREKTPVDAQRMQQALNNFLLGNRKMLEDIGDENLIKAADQMVSVRADLEEDLIRQLETEIGFKPADPKNPTKPRELATPDTPSKQKAYEALQEIKKNQDNQQGYLRRQFEQYINPVAFYKGLDLQSQDFDDAVEEVARLVVPSGQVVDDTTRALAKERVLDTLGLKTLVGESPEEALASKLKDITERAKGARGVIQRDRPVLASYDDIFVAREPLIDQSPKLQKLKGVITDPVEIYKKTISDMAQANAAADMYRSMANMGLSVNPVEAIELLSKGGRPAIVDLPDNMRMTPEEYDLAMQPFRDVARDQKIPREVVDANGNTTFQDPEQIALDQYKQRLLEKGYVPLGETRDIQHVFGGTFGDLTGRMVSPETNGAITAPLKFAGNTVLGEAAGILSHLRSLSQKMTIVPNPGAQVRNIAGNFLMLGANANLGRETDFSDMFKIFTSSLSDIDDAGLQRLAEKISLSGVEDTSLVVRALKDFRKAGEDLTSNVGKVAKTIDLWQDHIPFMQTFEKIYSDSDSFFKGLALLGEEKKILSAFNAAGIDVGNIEMFEAMIEQGLAKRLDSPVTEFTGNMKLLPHEVMAADVVKDTMPIYPRIGKAVRALDVFPLIGNFTSFASENIRNTANILDRGLKEMSFTVPPELRQKFGEEAASTFEKQIRAAGSQRLSSYLATAMIGPAQAVKASMYATGTTQEQYDAMKSQLPDYMDGHQLVILNNDGKGKIDYIDLSYVSPYAFVLDPARAALQIYKEQGKLDKSQIERIGAGAIRGLTMFAEPFGEESLVYERLRDVLPGATVVGRGGVSQDGYDIYRGTDTLGTKIDKSFGHLLNGIIPSYGAMIMEFDKPISGVTPGGSLRESFNQGRVLRSLTGTPDARGVEYKPFKEAARLVTGFTPMTADMRNDFKYAALEYTPRRTETKTAATQAMKKANLTQEDMLREWDTYMDNLYREQSKLYKNIEAARTMGMDDTDIRRNLVKGGNMGRAEANAIMNGEFWPTDASKELYKDIIALRQQEGRKFMTDMSDFSPFNQRARDRLREPLSVANPTPYPRAKPASDINFDDLIPQSQPQPELNFDDLIPQQQGSLPTPTPPIQTASAQVNPILLGNDPATQALAKSLGRSQ